jgi:hypothetical protein
MKTKKTIITLPQAFSGNKTIITLPQTNRRGLHTSPIVPVITYTNAEDQKVLILKENKRKSGVYR